MDGQLRIEKQIEELVLDSIDRAYEKGVIPFSSEVIGSVEIDVPKDGNFGDFSVNTAMKMAKPASMKPRELAGIIVDHFDAREFYISKIEVAGAGFINFYISNEYLYDELKNILEKGEAYGAFERDGRSINVEYVSANPTGPLHIGNARGGAIGDALANIYKRAGWMVEKEFYLNDAGNQIFKFAESLSSRYMQIFDPSYPFPDDGYQGEDVTALARSYYGEFGASLQDVAREDRQEALCVYALKLNADKMREDLSNYGINYDTWFSESSLYEKAVGDVIELLNKNGAVYEKDGALWFAATDYGCEKDEVLIRNNGISTYFASDIAYHYDKLVSRGFDIAVDVWGADHHGHIKRLQTALQALGIDPARLKVIIIQLVHLIDGDEAIRMSKRKGQIVTLSDLVSEVGSDAARFIFNLYNANTHMDFDLGLAVRQSNENPVFYVQYAHARMESILRNVKPVPGSEDFTLLKASEEIALLKKMSAFSKEIALAARDYDPTRITKYAYETASFFHSFYNACRVKNEDGQLTRARLALVRASAYVLKNALDIIGVSAPEQM